MDAGFERRAMRTFEALLDAAPATRSTKLRELCGGDAALEQAVTGLIRADAAASALPTGPPERAAAPDILASPPERIEEYKLTAELGRGGMGVVYRGERDDGVFEQQVAIKLIAQGLFSPASRAQFAAERRILARLRHPHIAQLFDGGATGDGVSYIIMELIEGAAIIDHVAAARCPLGERLRLFEEVCDAVEHAHRMLVVHGDIKPSNVVVDPRFGVKLLDFGIARLIDQPGTDVQAAYTPGFASPERRAGEPLTTSDDIYALGKLLGALIEHARGVDADLRAVAAKAAAEEPGARYPSVDALVGDLRRWRANFPVRARPARLPRRAGLVWRRHRLAVSAGAAMAASLLVALASLTALWRAAERDRRVAELRYVAAQQVSDAVVREALNAGWAHVRLVRDRVERRPDDPTARRALAASLEPLARTYIAAGDLKQGCALLRQTREVASERHDRAVARCASR